MKFKYQAKNEKGELQVGTVEASSEEAAIATLQAYKLVVISVTPLMEVSALFRNIKFFQKVKGKDLVIFSRQLATLIEAKITLLEALKTLQKQTSNAYFREIIFEMANDVEGGHSFSYALKKHPKVFSEFYVNLVKAGEVSGNLQESLIYLAEHTEKQYDLENKIKGAMAYPAFILVAFLAIGTIVLIYVIPNLIVILEESGQELPFTTKLLISSSKFLKSFGWLLIIFGIMAAIGMKQYTRASEGKKNWDKFLLKVPIIGELVRQICLIRFSENLSTLIKGGVPIVRSLQITGAVIGNEVFREITFEAAEKVKSGVSIAEVLGDNEEIPPIVVQMISIGERSGRLDSILDNIARFYSREVNNVVENLSTLIEPILIVIMGIGVGILVSAVLLPIYSIAGEMGM
jgi:type IV pilus assembly protein PilC